MNTHFLPKRILVLQTAFIGDVILTLPLVQRLKNLYPEALIDFLAIPAAGNLLETHPALHQLIIYDKRSQHKGLRNIWKLTQRLKQNRYDLAITPHRSLRSAVLLWAAAIPKRIGFKRSAGYYLFSTLLPYPPNVHEINRNLHLLKPLGVDPKEHIFPELHFTPEDHQQVESWLEKQNIAQNTPFISIAPGSIWATKRWLPEYFARLSETLDKSGYPVVLIGGKADESVAAEIQRNARHPIISAIGRFSLRQSALLIQKSRLLVTNDSAPLHLAVAVDTRIIAIFGATVPALGFYPYSPEDRVIENKQLTCRPCGAHGGHECPIGTFECMKQLTPDIVFEIIKKYSL